MPSNEHIIAVTQQEYFRLILDCVPQRVRDLMQRGSLSDMQMALAAELVQAPLYTASGARKSSTEVAFEETVRAIDKFWREKAEPLRLALADADLYGVTLETQRFPSQLPQYLRRF